MEASAASSWPEYAQLELVWLAEEQWYVPTFRCIAPVPC